MIMESTLIFGDIEFQKIRVTCIRSSTKHSHELKHIHITFSMQIYANTMFFTGSGVNVIEESKCST